MGGDLQDEVFQRYDCHLFHLHARIPDSAAILGREKGSIVCAVEGKNQSRISKRVKTVENMGRSRQKAKNRIPVTIESRSEQDTFEIAKDLATKLLPGSIVCLNGDLGTGKTVFAKGFAKGLGIEENITSPTFTIVQSYENGKTFHHFDVYRISDISEMDEIGYEEYFFGDAVCLIEWAGLIEELIPEDAIQVSIQKDLNKGLDYRRIEIVS